MHGSHGVPGTGLANGVTSIGFGVFVAGTDKSGVAEAGGNGVDEGGASVGGGAVGGGVAETRLGLSGVADSGAVVGFARADVDGDTSALEGAR